jgi:hypothetical protein
MCFEFEYLYWAKLEEEARQRKEEEKREQQARSSHPSPSVPPEQQDAIPA